MSARPPFKRRRLDNTEALSKPFKSPFKTPLKPTANPPPPSPLIQSPTPASSPTTLPPSKLPTPKPASPSKPSPELLALRRQQASLQAALSTARAELDSYTQALKIEQRGKDAELEALIRKWKGASREAAEEVFRGVKDKVDRMGGVKGWREAERRKREGFGGGYGWAEEGRKGGEGEDGEGEGDGDGGDWGEREGGEKRGRGGEDEIEEEEEEDKGFTMDMMLGSLNIELEVVGFDKEAQRWVD
ncbi:MAG: hypothetical protein HETSPECPRED_005740 [Heterodermia speciosa]|uniref:Swi5-dependent recombination DNA repair protein 1 homolog n=1 Tax=Heterodermia speciosa TaxID=116794 RepID=A0A8H3IN20_9LECA|nr:MAG: hypothetical protein HETSPECPRED_005740 [Heterodermia speciosa]